MRSEKILESSITRSTGTLASRGFGSHVCSASHLWSHRVPRPRARGLRTARAVPGTLPCSSCWLPAHRRNLLPFWHLGRSKNLPRCAQGWPQLLHMQSPPGNTGLGSGSFVPAREAQRDRRLFSSQSKYLHGVYVTTGTKWQPRWEQQVPRAVPLHPEHTRTGVFVTTPGTSAAAAEHPGALLCKQHWCHRVLCEVQPPHRLFCHMPVNIP